MKISILIPTRDRLELLQLAVSSALAQDDKNIEVLVSDNNSAESAVPWLESLQDSRLRWLRHEQTLPVTKNWNAALEAATGDYIIMLGDDDALCKTYVRSIRQLVQEHGTPDCIYHGAYLFTYPGVTPGTSEGCVHESRNAVFWRNGKSCYFLSRKKRLRLVNDAMRFYSSYGFNMQFVTLRRSLIEDLSRAGDFYQSPYPDYFAMNNVMLHAQRVLVAETPLVCIGVSPKSFGWYFQNNQEDSGNEHLGIVRQDGSAAGLAPGALLPGTTMNTNWLLAITTLKLANNEHGRLKPPSLARYRRKQIVFFALMIVAGDVTPSQQAGFRRLLSKRERAYLSLLLTVSAAFPSRAAFLRFLHTLSQKRIDYVLRAGLRRLFSATPVLEVERGKTILDTELIVAPID